MAVEPASFSQAQSVRGLPRREPFPAVEGEADRAGDSRISSYSRSWRKGCMIEAPLPGTPLCLAQKGLWPTIKWLFRGQVDDPATSRRIFPPRCACATASLIEESGKVAA